MSSVDALIQGLYSCGSYERGHAYLGKMTRMDIIHADTGLSDTTDLSRAYFVAFDQVRLKLKEAWRLNQFSNLNHPGWDLSPFGYITKTIRDKEFFYGGDVPGECILEAIVVDRMAHQKDVIANQRASGASGSIV
jgi:hypothetical protein